MVGENTSSSDGWSYFGGVGDLTSDSEGAIYFASAENPGGVFKYDGTVTRVFDIDMTSSEGLAVDSLKNIYFFRRNADSHDDLWLFDASSGLLSVQELGTNLDSSNVMQGIIIIYSTRPYLFATF